MEMPVLPYPQLEMGGSKENISMDSQWNDKKEGQSGHKPGSAIQEAAGLGEVVGRKAESSFPTQTRRAGICPKGKAERIKRAGAEIVIILLAFIVAFVSGYTEALLDAGWPLSYWVEVIPYVQINWKLFLFGVPSHYAWVRLGLIGFYCKSWKAARYF